MIIVITGAGSGLGRELAKVYSDGNDLILVGRSLEKLEETKREIEGAKSINCISCDITNPQSVENLKEKNKTYPQLCGYPYKQRRCWHIWPN